MPKKYNDDTLKNKSTYEYFKEIDNIVPVYASIQNEIARLTTVRLGEPVVKLTGRKSAIYIITKLSRKDKIMITTGFSGIFGDVVSRVYFYF